MNRVKLSNIPLEDFRRFLFDMGCTRIVQTHVDPVTEMAVRSNLHSLGLTRKDLEEWLLKNK